MSNMINCKTCGVEMAKSAKTCPKCGAKNKKPLYKRVWFWILMGILTLCVIGVGTSGNSAEEVEVTIDPMTGVVEVETVEETPVVEEIEFEEIVIFDDENCSFVITGTDSDEDWGYWYLEVYLENKTDETLMFSIDEVSVNGYMIDPFWGSEVSAGKKENTEVIWSFEEFAENNIENVEEISFTLNVNHYDEETWDATEYVSEVYTVTFE